MRVGYLNQDVLEMVMKFDNFIQEMKLRGYSKQTIDQYLYFNTSFFGYVGKEARQVRSSDIRSYLLFLLAKGAQPRTINLVHNALKCYYGSFLNKKLFGDIKRSKIPNDMPNIISKEEIMSMINNTNFLKHKLLIELLYSSGIRVGEAVKIRIEDIDIDEKIIFIKKGKGSKDRFVITSQKFIFHLKDYLKNKEKQSIYLFDNNTTGHITIRSAEEIVKSAAKRAGIRKRVYPHLLRACFATHILENGVQLHEVQKLLGHADIKTTKGYVNIKTDHLKKIKSPLD